MTRAATLCLLALGSSGCDALVGFPDVPPIADAADAPLDVSRPRDARADARDARADGKDARVDARDGTVPRDSRPSDVVADSPVDAGVDASCCACRGGQPVEAGCVDTLAFEAGLPSAIVLDDAHLYWVSAGIPGSVRRTPLSSSDADPPVTLAGKQAESFRVALDDAHVYWVQFGAPTDAGAYTGRGSVVRVALDGGTPQTLATALTLPYGIAVSGGVVYFTEDAINQPVEEVAVDGGAATAAFPATASGYNWAITAADASVYWTTYVNATEGNVSVNMGPHASKALVGALDEPWAVAVSGSALVWATRANVVEVATLPLAGGAARPVWTGNVDAAVPYGVALDDHAVYWTENPGDVVMRAALDGGAPITLYAAPPGAAPTGIAVDDASVYWSEYATGKIKKLTPK